MRRDKACEYRKSETCSLIMMVLSLSLSLSACGIKYEIAQANWPKK